MSLTPSPSPPTDLAPERSVFRALKAGAFQPASGQRIYAVGDIHGREDLFERLMALIEQDSRSRSATASQIVLLGDVIDRGPDSASLVRRLKAYSELSDRFTVLKGNHEQLMVGALEGDHILLKAWLGLGGAETLISWGVDPALLLEAEPGYPLIRSARDLIGPDVLAWIDRRPFHFRSGRVVFVHAGVRPGVPFRRQKPEDLLWIRQEFLDSDENRGFLTVHGHTISEAGPVVTPNRIGIDTGAYRTDRLTAVGMEGGQRWFINT